jgi:hypothetical protein
MQMKQDCSTQMPRKSLVQKGEKCKGGKLCKERLSVLFCLKDKVLKLISFMN